MIERADVVAAARAHLGTKFLHQGRKRGVGIDCAGLVIMVARELGLVDKSFDVRGYPGEPDGTTLVAICRQQMTQVTRAQMGLGDVCVFSFGLAPQHLGIAADYRHGGLSIIHASSIVGRIVEQRLMFSPKVQFVAAFRMPGVA